MSPLRKRPGPVSTVRGKTHAAVGVGGKCFYGPTPTSSMNRPKPASDTIHALYASPEEPRMPLPRNAARRRTLRRRRSYVFMGIRAQGDMYLSPKHRLWEILAMRIDDLRYSTKNINRFSNNIGQLLSYGATPVRCFLSKHCYPYVSTPPKILANQE